MQAHSTFKLRWGISKFQIDRNYLATLAIFFQQIYVTWPRNILMKQYSVESTEIHSHMDKKLRETNGLTKEVTGSLRKYVSISDLTYICMFVKSKLV